MSERGTVYVARDDASPEHIVRSLLALLPARQHSIARRRFTALDTFDGRVRRAGAQLTQAAGQSGPVLTWEPEDGGGHVATPLSQDPDFAWNLPDGPLRRTLAPVIGVRRLLPQADIDVHGSELDVLDRQGKTVARLRILRGQARLADRAAVWAGFPAVVSLVGLRGYEHEHSRLARVVESRPSLTRSVDGIQDVILRHAGAPQPVGSSPRVSLTPDVRADEGARLIHRSLLAILRANEPGLRKRLDTEFLHDFRVAVRRIRALLRQIKRVFPADAVERFSSEFAWLGRLTGPPRDLDVLALDVREHTDLADGDRQALLDYLAVRQADEHRGLVDALDGNRYRQLTADWQAFLEQPLEGPVDAANAAKPLAEVIARRARRLLRRIGKAGRHIDARTSGTELHDLRIDAKKLRYLVDATPDPSGAGLEPILRSLKKLQRVLGDFNDAQVQESRLSDIGRSFAAAGGGPTAVLAVGRLVQTCRQRGVDLRPRITGALAEFVDEDTQHEHHRIFKRLARLESLR